MRSLVGVLLGLVVLTNLLLIMPYKRLDDNLLDVTGQLVLICIFMAAIYTKVALAPRPSETYRFGRKAEWSL